MKTRQDYFEEIEEIRKKREVITFRRNKLVEGKTYEWISSSKEVDLLEKQLYVLMNTHLDLVTEAMKIKR